jgi:predicted metal-dependent peptidase
MAGYHLIGSSVTDKIMDARCRVLSTDPFYGTMASMFTWVEDNHRVPTMGVCVLPNGQVICTYNHDFCEEVGNQPAGIKLLMDIIRHEIEHIVRLHPVRLGPRDPELWNIVADMCINGKRRKPNILGLLQLEEAIGMNLIWLPDDWADDITAEEAYDKLERCRVEIEMWKFDPYGAMCGDCGGTGKQGGGQGGDKESKDGESKSGDGSGGQEKDKKKDKPCPKCGGSGEKKDGKKGKGKGLEKFFKKEVKVAGDPNSKKKFRVSGAIIGDHSTWSDSTCSEDDARQAVKNMIESAARAAGKMPGHMQEILKGLGKAKIRWRSQIRHFVGRNYGGKRKTFSRLNRRVRDPFGLKGKSKHANIPLTILVDTSGSISTLVLKQFFTEIESISKYFKITILEFTAKGNNHYKYRRGDWKNITIQDRCGTNFEAALKYCEDQKIIGRLNIIITDGEDRCPKAREYPILWAICPHNDAEFDRIKQRLNWGDHVHIQRSSL